MNDLKLMLETDDGGSKVFEDTPKLWLQWEALKAYIASFKTELNASLSRLLWWPLFAVNHDEDFEPARDDVLDEIEMGLRRVKAKKRLLFAHDDVE